MIDTTFSEAEAIGRIQADLDALRAEFSRGAKRSLPNRKRLWSQIQVEAGKCDHALDPGTKPRAPKAAKTPAAQATTKVAEAAP